MKDRKLIASLEIERMLQEDKELSYLEAVLLWSDVHEIEFSDVKKHLAPALYDKLYNECKNANMIIDKNSSASMNEFF